MVNYFGIPYPMSIKYHLILRYWKRASPRLKREARRMERNAPREMEQLFREELQKRSSESFLAMIPKDESWLGGCLIVPFQT